MENAALLLSLSLFPLAAGIATDQAAFLVLPPLKILIFMLGNKGYKKQKQTPLLEKLSFKG